MDGYFTASQMGEEIDRKRVGVRTRVLSREHGAEERGLMNSTNKDRGLLGQQEKEGTL